MHALSTVLVLVFGGATLLFHDPRFLKVKPTLLLWLLALAFLGSQWIGRKPLAQRMLEPALPPGTSLPRQQLAARQLGVGGRVRAAGRAQPVRRASCERAGLGVLQGFRTDDRAGIARDRAGAVAPSRTRGVSEDTRA